MRPAKTLISLGIRPVWSKLSLSTWRRLGSLATHWTHSEDSDQTGRMPRLIWVFAGRTCHFVGFIMRRLILHTLLCPFSLPLGDMSWLWLVIVALPGIFYQLRHGKGLGGGGGRSRAGTGTCCNHTLKSFKLNGIDKHGASFFSFFIFLFGFYGPSRLFHSFWAESM